MSYQLDIHAVLITPQYMDAMALLCGRFCLESRYGRAVCESLLGKDSSTFGKLQCIDYGAVKHAFEQSQVTPRDAVAYTQLVTLIHAVSPQTTVCDICNEFGLGMSGSELHAIDKGCGCPLASCANGRLKLPMIKLRTLAWTNGCLVEPSTRFDLEIVSGSKIPLTDDGLVPFFQEKPFLRAPLKRLLNALSEYGVPLYGYLAYIHLVRDVLKSPLAAVQLIAEPKAFGLRNDDELRDAILEAGDYLAKREITNQMGCSTYERTRRLEDAPRLKIADRTYIVEGKLGQGEHASVYRGCTDRRTPEVVLIKMAHERTPESVLPWEAHILRTLQNSQAVGADYATRLLPIVISTDDRVRNLGGEIRQATVFRYSHLYGFDWTVADVCQEYPEGVDDRAMVWMWKRTLMLLGWVHRNNFAHQAVTPDHILLQPNDHGATLLSWSRAVQIGAKAEPPSDGYHDYCPEEILNGGRVTPATDIAMTARCMIKVLGGNPQTGDLPSSVRAQFADLLRIYARYGKRYEDRRLISDATELEKKVAAVAKDVYGPPSFHHLPLPRPRGD